MDGIILERCRIWVLGDSTIGQGEQFPVLDALPTQVRRSKDLVTCGQREPEVVGDVLIQEDFQFSRYACGLCCN